MSSPLLETNRRAGPGDSEGGRQDHDGVRARAAGVGGTGRGSSSSPAHPLCSQLAVKSVQFLNTDMWSKELLLALTKPDRTHQEQPPEKVGHTVSLTSTPCAHDTGPGPLSLGCTPKAGPGALERH